MHTFTITLPESHTVVSRGKGVEINVAALSADIVARLVIHGLTQKVADAAAGAKGAAGEGATDDDVAETARNLMAKVADTLARGEWGVERGNGGVSALVAECRIVLRPLVKAKFSNWKSMDEKERVAKIDAALAGLTDEQRAKVEAKAQSNLDAKAAEAAEAKALAAELGSIEL